MVARRTSSGAGFVGQGPQGVGDSFKRVDFYAKLPRELAEGSVAGGVLSILMVSQSKSLKNVCVERERERWLLFGACLSLRGYHCSTVFCVRSSVEGRVRRGSYGARDGIAAALLSPQLTPRCEHL